MINPESDTRMDYKIRITRVLHYIDENLHADVSLARISEIAFFSPFHFHRIFKQITGEAPGEYITRRRVEKAAADLINKVTPISDIFVHYGFTDNSSFTRTFKKFYGVSPTEFRKVNPNKFSKISQVVSKIGQAYPDADQYLCVINDLQNWIKMNANIQIKELGKMSLARISSIGHQNLPTAYQKLLRWATPLGLLTENTKMITLYHDSFKITEPDKVRMDACILLNEPVKAEGEVTLSSIDSGKFIVGSFVIGLDEFEKSWTGLYLWMNENGYRKADRNPFELYHNDFNKHPERKAIVDFYIPVE
ncbi:MAG: AraC family transcriptional regulator [Bacteroidota bacterium]